MNKAALILVIAITAVSLGGCFVGKGKAPVPVCLQSPRKADTGGLGQACLRRYCAPVTITRHRAML